MSKVYTETIVMIGAGNLANSLAPALNRAGYRISQVYSRTEDSALSLSTRLKCEYTTKLSQIRNDASIYFLVLTDQATLTFINEFNFPDAMIVHVSGGLNIDVLRGSALKYGVFYPIQTFSKGLELEFKNIPICIEAGDQVSEERLMKIAKKLSDIYYKIDSLQRKYLHAAAVFACNYVNHMYDISSEILREASLPFSLLHPLIRETAEKAIKNQPNEVQTGPAVRNDMVVINEHLKLLATNKHYQHLYKILSESIIKSAETDQN